MKALLRFALVSLGAALTAFPAMIYQGPVPGGGGFGSVGTVLTLQSPANSTTASGCVGWGNSQTVTVHDPDGFGGTICPSGILGGNEKPPSDPPHNDSFLLADVGPAGDIGIIFNSADPGGGSITFDNLVVSLFTSTGNLFWQSSGLICPTPGSGAGYTCGTTVGNITPITLTSTDPGIGNAGFLFYLDDAQALAAQIAAQAAGPGVRIGLAVNLSGEVGGQETFLLQDLNLQREPPVPEPATFLLIGAGLLGLTALRRR